MIDRYIPRCRLCRKPDQNILCYRAEAEGVCTALDLCDSCMEIAANQFWMRHSGEWLTWGGRQEQARPARKKIPRALAKRVMERDEYRCRRCRTHKDLTCDHIAPAVHGGPTTEENLQTLCRPCNSSKGASL